MRVKSKAIDSEKLLAEFKKRNLTAGEVSAQMGHTNSFMSHILRQGKITVPNMVVLSNMFHISYDSIKPDEIAETAINTPASVETPECKTGEVVGIDYDKLFNVICAAVKKAFSE